MQLTLNNDAILAVSFILNAKSLDLFWIVSSWLIKFNLASLILQASCGLNSISLNYSSKPSLENLWKNQIFFFPIHLKAIGSISFSF